MEIEIIYYKEPAFSFNSDVDYTVEATFEMFLTNFYKRDLSLTMFVTHESPIFSRYNEEGLNKTVV